MKQAQITSKLPMLSLPFVEQSSIVQFEKTAPEIQELYRELFKNNQELALWLRQKAEILYDDLEDREASVTLALQALTILGNQVTINGLSVVLQSPQTEKKSKSK